MLTNEKKKIINESFIKEIGKRFKEFRQAIKKSQKELADELNVCQATIASIEIGRSFPSIPFQIYLYCQYHLGIKWLITGSGEMILPPGKDSKNSDSHTLFWQIDENDPRFERYVELISLMSIPEIEQVILGKLEELKLRAKDEIKSFLKNMIYPKSIIMTKQEKICEEIIKIIFKSDLKSLQEMSCHKLALMYGIDRSYLSRIFKDCHGIYLSESLKRLKLLRCAFFMLENRDITIKETSALFGFESLPHFLISFKKFLGITPGKFLKCSR